MIVLTLWYALLLYTAYLWLNPPRLSLSNPSWTE